MSTYQALKILIEMKTDFKITNVYKHNFQIRKDEIYSSDHDEVKETSNF